MSTRGRGATTEPEPGLPCCGGELGETGYIDLADPRLR